MFDLTTIQLRNVETKMNSVLLRSGAPKLSPGELVESLKNATTETNRIFSRCNTPVDMLDSVARI